MDPSPPSGHNQKTAPASNASATPARANLRPSAGAPPVGQSSPSLGGETVGVAVLGRQSSEVVGDRHGRFPVLGLDVRPQLLLERPHADLHRQWSSR